MRKGIVIDCIEKGGGGFRKEATLLSENLVEISTEFKDVDTEMWESAGSIFISRREFEAVKQLFEQRRRNERD